MRALSIVKAWSFAITAMLAACVGLLTIPAHAKSSDELADVLAGIRAQDQRMQDIGWKLVTANAPYCAKTTQSIGLQLVDVAAYKQPDKVRSAFGLAGDFAVYTIAANSPAAEASLTPMEPITAIDGQMLESWPSRRQSDWERLVRAHDAIDASLSADGAVQLSLGGDRQAAINSTLVCASRFELGGGNKRALADGERVILGRNFPGFAYVEDELAAAIAHELAHNFLAHRDWLEANGRKRKNIRLTEGEADRLMPWLLANAGYDPKAALRFMQRWGPKHGGGLLRKRTHDGWDERVEFIAAEIALIEALLERNQPANWSAHFQRDTQTGPDTGSQ
ncbi:MAG: hypothetical protein ABJ239_05400 [Erythrobacter sp.]